MPGTADLLARTRCANHEAREAAARCPRCRRFFCRECVTEHEGLFVCAACLSRAAGAADGEGAGKHAGTWARARKALLSGLGAGARLAGGLVLLWLCFYLAGKILIRIPDSFHEGTVWENAGKKTGDGE